MQNKMTKLPQGWEWRSLGGILSNDKYSIKRGPFGSALKKSFFVENGIRVFEQYNAINNDPHWKRYFISYDKFKELEAFKAIEGDLLISCSGTLGKIVELPKNTEIGIINQALLKIRLDNTKILNSYFIYNFNSPIMQGKILESTLGSAIKNIASVKILKQIKIPLPPLQEQERIVGILDESFAKIDESIKILEQDLLNLDELMQSALQKAFNPLKDNTKENYKLPQGWEWKSLGEICFITDGTHKTPSYIKTGIPFLSVKNISKGFFDLSDIKYISLEEHNKLIKRAKPEFGDILICRIGTLGKAIKISLDFEFSIFVSLGLLKPKVKIISDYLVYFLNSYFIERWIDNNKVGGGTHTAKLNLNILEKCPIALPPLKEQEQIASHLDELSSHVKNLKQNYQMQIKNLQELKKSLLDKAFQGRL
ncbi:restriction endonuclease subunit S [Campylobacter lari]|uniref:restriction endonuclease subunit S n=1 Tax=Campylobacter lari TaxID=201 RepID=UPI000B0A5EDB|nr:restriction endonuclease subunit S [Campylobacter lari]MCV3331430.1 restriction endonuclease subunit S [Campylobacter lari]MCV3335792.1 restriction endonuclease subunit S [Campylobacter lari]MCV3342437.1 restriction endonuclease subunit S [Campylobacter lari]MCV3347733.1 restriction endonuclease subunit S [Campylobacter lari]MCV3351938.1 restriction endonuclease subunit S [Campylobacter lari]